MPERHGAFAARYGLKPGFACKRMYMGVPPLELVENEYGVLCWELTF